jgi:hypothetical protein
MHQTFGTKNEKKVFALIQTLLQQHFTSSYLDSLFWPAPVPASEAVLLNALGWTYTATLFPKQSKLDYSAREEEDTFLLPTLLSSSEKYTGAVEELELLLKRRSNRCVV